LVCLAWVFFRADSLTQALLILRKMVRLTRHSQLGEACAQQPLILYGCLGAVLLFVFEAWQANRDSKSAGVHLPRAVRWAGYYALVASILLLGNNGAAQFIYFQF
jgi:hypothetical protein